MHTQSRDKKGAASREGPAQGVKAALSLAEDTEVIRSYFAVAAPGLEPITAQELRGLRISGQVTAGGVEFRGNRRMLYQANLHLRTASRVLVRLGEFHASAFSELRKKASRLPWEQYLQPGQPVAIKATCHKSKLYHSDAVTERVAGAIGDRLGRGAQHQAGSDETELPPGAEHTQFVLVRLVRDMCTVSLDSSGALLHQRGYRLATAKAPLRETLAAGLLLACEWNPAAPLLDPFCGAGTIPIEAALLALRIAPGRARRFAFMDWPDFDAELWKALLAEADAARLSTLNAPLLGSDRDAGAITEALENAARAGVADALLLSRRSISEVEPPPGPGWVVTNPPYGTRLGQGPDLRNLYAQFGKVLRQKCPGWQAGLLSGGDARLLHATGLSFDERRSLPLMNGGLRVTLVQGQIPAAGY